MYWLQGLGFSLEEDKAKLDSCASVCITKLLKIHIHSTEFLSLRVGEGNQDQITIQP